MIVERVNPVLILQRNPLPCLQGKCSLQQMEPISRQHGGVFMYLMCVFACGGCRFAAMHGNEGNHYR